MKISINIPDKLTPEIESAVDNMKSESMVDKLNAVCFWLVKQCHDTNAKTMTVTLEGMHNQEKQLGDFKITVEQVAEPKQ